MNRIVRLVPCVVWMAGIYYMSSRTGDDLDSWLPAFRRLIPGMASFDWGHIFAYFGLALTYLAAFDRRSPAQKLIVVLLCAAYGVTDEFHQSFVPGRSPDVMDLRNDTIGALLAMLFASIPAVDRLFRRATSP